MDKVENAKSKKVLSIKEALSTKSRGKFLGFTADDYIQNFFTVGATIAIIILVLIITFLFKEGAGFVPEYRHHLELYRQAGLEYVEFAQLEEEEHKTVTRYLNQIRLTEFNSSQRKRPI